MDETILKAIPGDNPSGENLRYAPIYDEIRAQLRMAERIPLPDHPEFTGTFEHWRFVARACQKVLEQRSKDLTIAAWLTKAQFATNGLPGLRDGLDILRGLFANFWETLYPEIQDGNAQARERIPQWLDPQLAGFLQTAFAVKGKVSDPDDPMIRLTRQQVKRELDGCLDSLSELVSVCSDKFGDHAPWFGKLRGELLRHMNAESNLTALLVGPPAAFEKAPVPPDRGRSIRVRDLSEGAGQRRSVIDPVPSGDSRPQSRDMDIKGGKGVRLGDGSAPGSPVTSEVPIIRRIRDLSEGADQRRPSVPTPESSPAPAMPAPIIARELQKVEFTLTAPVAVAPQVPFELFVWAHESQERAKVLARAREELNVRDLLARSKGPFQVASGTVLSVRLVIPGAVIDEAEDTMAWEGESTCVSFVVTLPEASSETKWAGSALIYANGLRIARISFVLSAVGVAGVSSVHFRKAFASYASDDRDAVLGRIQGIHKVAPEMEIFLDVMSLRSGQNWEQELWRVIPASDIFYLFWSSHARTSEWVEKEWRCALRERGLDFIDPIPLESPHHSPPPEELSSLHFNDWELAFMRGKTSADRL